MTKEELTKLSKQYFDSNKALNQIIACSDGNFFYTDADASYHFAKNDVQKFVITREDLNPHVEVKKEIEKEPLKKVEKKIVKKFNKYDK